MPLDIFNRPLLRLLALPHSKIYATPPPHPVPFLSRSTPQNDTINADFPVPHYRYCFLFMLTVELCKKWDCTGAAAYGTLSLINHSCDPNVVRNYYNSQAVVRAVR
jgi:hypothetical protein